MSLGRESPLPLPQSDVSVWNSAIVEVVYMYDALDISYGKTPLDWGEPDFDWYRKLQI